jgi:preprotein translocase subunit SecD
MNDFPRWKYVLVAVVLLLGVLYGIPNLFPQQPALQVSANRGATIDAALKERAQGVLEKAKIPFQGVELAGDRLVVRFAGVDDQTKASDALRTELGDSYIVALNLASTVPAWMRAIGANAMPLGLDLRGGVHFLMQVDDKDVMDKQLQRYADDIRATLREKNIRYQSVGRGGPGLVVQLRSEQDRDAALTAIQAKIPDITARPSAMRTR